VSLFQGKLGNVDETRKGLIDENVDSIAYEMVNNGDHNEGCSKYCGRFHLSPLESDVMILAARE